MTHAHRHAARRVPADTGSGPVIIGPDTAARHTAQRVFVAR